MARESELVHPAHNPARWLEVIDGDAPLLLLAPHGGRAGRAARTTLHPKVNDLYTAEITRELARRLGASALINSVMDRNRLDCNRIGQLAATTPWLLEMIAAKVERLVADFGRAVVLLIHGWNVIEPRLDFGLGLRGRGGRLIPAGAAAVSASDEFINGTLAPLAERLARDGIASGFGVRYPGGGLHNLLQAFTTRHLQSPVEALRRLGAIAHHGAIDAVQLELSVALRLPGRIRERAVSALGESFAKRHSPRTAKELTVIRHSTPRSVPRPKRAPPVASPARVGIEFYDSAARIGAMASFDLGGTGARIMLLLGERRVALFTAEGVPECDDHRIRLGPLALVARSFGLALEFRGPAVIVPDGATYLSIERALAAGSIDEEVEVSMRFEPHSPAAVADGAAAGLGRLGGGFAAAAGFGRLDGRVAIDGAARELGAVGRVGLSFSGIGATRFTARRMIWACFPDHPELSALEARMIRDGGAEELSARVVAGRAIHQCDLLSFDLDTPAPEKAPERLAAELRLRDGERARILGMVESFIPLSRPGPGQSRIYTSLGFATFGLGGYVGSGMFEYSRRSEARLDGSDGEPDED